MVFLLVLLAIYIPKASNPRSWDWLVTGGDSGQYRVDPTTLKAEQPTTSQAKTLKPTTLLTRSSAPTSAAVAGTTLPAAATTAAAVPTLPAEATTVAAAQATGAAVAGPSVHKPATDRPAIPLDMDPEQAKFLKEESEMLIDRSEALKGIEMPAYWRLLRWARASSMEELEKRASRGLVFNHFAQQPNKYRGKLVRLKLNVRRVLPCEEVVGQPEGTPQLYEMWGVTEESQAWLYVIVTPDLPPGLEVGPRINEEIIFNGYFLKLQGYEEAGAKPNAKPLYAPMLIGRVALAKPLPAPKVTEHQTVWLLIAGGILGAGVLLVWFVVRARSSRHQAHSGRAHPLPWEEAEGDNSQQPPSWTLTPDGKVRFDDIQPED